MSITADHLMVGGDHCETSAVRKLLAAHGFTVSEALLFGLAGGLGFMYERPQQGSRGFLGGRNGPFPVFTARMVEGVGLHATVIHDNHHTPEDLAETLKEGPQIVYGDMYYLPYMHASRHFGAHALVVAECDGSGVTVSDRPAALQQVDFADLNRARTSVHEPFPPRQARLVAEWSKARHPDAAQVWRSLQSVQEAMLAPAAPLGGIEGIRAFRADLRDRLTQDEDGTADLLVATFIDLETAGTGGAAFRRMYRDAVTEFNSIVDGQLTDVVTNAGDATAAWSAFIDGLLPTEIEPARQIHDSLRRREALLRSADTYDHAKAGPENDLIQSLKADLNAAYRAVRKHQVHHLGALLARVVDAETRLNESLTAALNRRGKYDSDNTGPRN